MSFHTRLTLLLENIGQPLAERVSAALAKGWLKPLTTVFPNGRLALQQVIGKLTPDEYKALIGYQAWFQDGSGDWVFDVRKIPGVKAPSTKPTANPTAVAKLKAAVARGRILPGNVTMSSVLTTIGLTPPEIQELLKFGILQRVNDDGVSGYDVNVKALN